MPQLEAFVAYAHVLSMHCSVESNSSQWYTHCVQKNHLFTIKTPQVMCNVVNVMQEIFTRRTQSYLSQLIRAHIHSHVPAQMRHWNWAENKAAANTVICFSAVVQSGVLPSSTLLITIIKKLRLSAATNSFHSGHFSALLIFKTQHKHTDRTLEKRHHNPHRLCCLHPTCSH